MTTVKYTFKSILDEIPKHGSHILLFTSDDPIHIDSARVTHEPVESDISEILQYLQNIDELLIYVKEKDGEEVFFTIWYGSLWEITEDSFWMYSDDAFNEFKTAARKLGLIDY